MFLFCVFFFFFKQKTAYEITYGDWSSDVCSSDLPRGSRRRRRRAGGEAGGCAPRDAPGAGGAARGRSEERRVGKECRRLCRSRWSPRQRKKKGFTAPLRHGEWRPPPVWPGGRRG